MNVKEKFKEYCEKVLKKPFQDIKSNKWWWETHGILIDDLIL